MPDNTDGCRQAANSINAVASSELVTLTGDPIYFETDQAITDTPTLYLDVKDAQGRRPRAMLLEEVSYYMNQTGAVTYQLRLLQAATADDVDTLTDIVFWSPTAQADSVYYSYHATGYQATISTAEVAQYKLPRVVNFETAGRLYYMLDWSGAPGTTPGFIKVRGRFLR